MKAGRQELERTFSGMVLSAHTGEVVGTSIEGCRFLKGTEIMRTELKAKQNKSYSVWIIVTVLDLIVLLVTFSLLTIIIDPFMHYHAPLDGYGYPLNNEWYQDKLMAYQHNKERYQNDGIIKNYQYNSIITGTSMVENFKTSEADKLFEVDFIKVPFSGGGV